MWPVQSEPSIQNGPGFTFPTLKNGRYSTSGFEKSVIAHFVMLVRPKVIVELGVFEALTTQFLCELVASNGIPTKIYGFDLPEVIEKIRRTNEKIEAFEKDGLLRLVPGCLPVSLEKWLKMEQPEIGIAIVDATHDYPSVLGELNLL